MCTIDKLATGELFNFEVYNPLREHFFLPVISWLTSLSLLTSIVDRVWYLKLELNQRPSGYESDALTCWAIQAFIKE